MDWGLADAFPDAGTVFVPTDAGQPLELLSAAPVALRGAGLTLFKCLHRQGHGIAQPTLKKYSLP